MTDRTADVRARIVRAARDLLAAGGRDAVSTRAVSAAAGVQAPTIYRQFGDMRGLLDAVAHETLAGYVDQKRARERADDPVEALRRGWDLHVAFGLAHPAAYALIYGDPSSGISAASREAEGILHDLIAHVAEAGRLRMSVPHAARALAAAGRGVTLSLIATPLEARDPRLSAIVREAILTAITAPAASDDERDTDATPGPARVAARAVALHAVLADTPSVLSPAEHQLLGEWLDRLAGATG